MLKISKIEDAQDTKNEGKYRKITFRQVGETKSGQEIYSNMEQSRNVFGESKINDIISKAETCFSLVQEGVLKIGANFQGNIIKFKTTPYRIQDNEVTSATFVVFDGEDPEKYANSQLKRNKAVVVREDGSLSTEIPQDNQLVAEHQQ